MYYIQEYLSEQKPYLTVGYIQQFQENECMIWKILCTDKKSTMVKNELLRFTGCCSGFCLFFFFLIGDRQCVMLMTWWMHHRLFSLFNSSTVQNHLFSLKSNKSIKFLIFLLFFSCLIQYLQLCRIIYLFSLFPQPLHNLSRRKFPY